MQISSVLIVEDDENIRRWLAETVGASSALDLAGATESCRSTRQFLHDHDVPDVVLIDLGLPDGSGIDLIRHAKALRATTEIMVLSMFDDEDRVVAAIEAGASGYLLKGDERHRVAEAIVDLLAGKSPISGGIARHVLRRMHAPCEPAASAAAEPARLSGREHQVLELIARGLTYAEIAELLSISVHTVTTHIQNVYGKLQVRSRNAAVFEAVQLGIIELAR